MTMTGTQSKQDRRRALETPYSNDHERSLEARMGKGVQPRNLDALVAWFRGVIDDETPVSLHKPGVWRDHGEHAEGGSHLGAPAISDAFRRFIEGVPWQTDPDGYYVLPFRSALSRISRRWPMTARHLYRLALVDGDWRRHADNVAWQREEMELYIAQALRMLWREYSEMGRLT